MKNYFRDHRARMALKHGYKPRWRHFLLWGDHSLGLWVAIGAGNKHLDTSKEGK